jgi:protein-S-isoprenylcysteine O-methyltransferase Ste14
VSLIDVALVLCPVAIWTIVSLRSRERPRRAIWPPRTGNAVTAAWAWGITILIYAGLWNTGADNWNPHRLPDWLTWGVGGGLSTLGTLLHVKTVADLGMRGTSGWDIGVVDRGTYGHLRHPQYLAQGLVFIGWGLWAANLPTLMLAAVATAALWLVGDTEERVLAARHPRAYRAYRMRTSGWLPTRISQTRG